MIDVVAESPQLRLILLVLLFVLVVTSAFFIAEAINARQLVRRRIADGTMVESGHQVMGSLRTIQVEGMWLKLVNSIEQKGISLVDTKDATVRQTLIAGGFSAPYAPRVYTLIRLVAVIGLPILTLALFAATGSSPSIMKLYFSLIIAAAMGLYIPSLYVRVRAARRQREIVNAFPDALDLMLVCVEAGLGLEASFSRVGMEMITSHPLLAEQFGAVVLELRAGRSHEDALRRMADRAGVDDIRAFATLLIQSTKLGSSIAQTLRTYSSEMREKRRMRAEEKAHRLPVLISIPLVACMLPTMIGVLMLPAAIRVVRAVLPALHG
jgi:tight adherence protein C